MIHESLCESMLLHVWNRVLGTLEIPARTERPLKRNFEFYFWLPKDRIKHLADLCFGG